MATLTIILRLATGLGVVLALGAVGFTARSPWALPLYAVVCTILYVIGKSRAWTRAYRDGGAGQIARALGVTLPIQGILVALFYLLGLGLGRLLGDTSGFAPFGPDDWLGAGLLLAIGGALGLTVEWIERRSDIDHARDALAEAHRRLADVDARAEQAELGPTRLFGGDADRLEIDPAPLTPQTFFEAPYYGHRDAPEAAIGSDEKIAAAEARLGLALPESLRALYRRQNGGYVGWLFVPAVPDPGPVDGDWRGAFSIDYSDLAPLENLRTLRDAYLDFLNPDDPEQAAQIPENADRILLLSQRYMDTTYLDYSEPGEPRAGIKDWDGSRFDPDVEFETFAALFAALRRQAQNA